MYSFTLANTPSSEGTGLFCRIPWPEFSRAPWIFHPTHLCWFSVRFSCFWPRRFSWQHGINECRVSALTSGICLRDLPTCFYRDVQHPARLSSCVSPSKNTKVREIFTRFPSATPFSLALGADLPWEDYLYPGNLGFTANRFLACFIVTHVSIITSLTSTKLYSSASSLRERSPTTC